MPPKTGIETISQKFNQLQGDAKNYEGMATGGSRLPDLSPGGAKPQTIVIGAFSTKAFLRAAQVTANEARALSQLLSLYADQVDQNAKAIIP